MTPYYEKMRQGLRENQRALLALAEYLGAWTVEVSTPERNGDPRKIPNQLRDILVYILLRNQDLQLSEKWIADYFSVSVDEIGKSERQMEIILETNDHPMRLRLVTLFAVLNVSLLFVDETSEGRSGAA